jgi:PKD repeat protein
MLGGIIAWKDAGYPTAGGEPLVADADGPYEAFESESIQFEGSAEGGEPPYSFHWDFGNGDTSDVEDPVYTYDEPGVYEVILTVTDDAQNTADDNATATINEKPCCFEVLIPPGFNFGLNAEVTEICDESHMGVPWEFEISGGLFVIPISPLTGTADFAAGETKTIKVPLVIGIGSIQITFTIGEYCDPTIVNAFIIGPFVIVS